MKTTGAACVSEELYRLLKEEEVGQIVSLGDSRIQRVRGRLAILSTLTVRVVLYKKPYSSSSLVCEFGGFENVLRNADIRTSAPSV